MLGLWIMKIIACAILVGLFGGAAYGAYRSVPGQRLDGANTGALMGIVTVMLVCSVIFMVAILFV